MANYPPWKVSCRLAFELLAVGCSGGSILSHVRTNFFSIPLIVLGNGGHCGMVNNNGCQELPLIPPVWITSTNRHAHLIPLTCPLDSLDLSNIQSDSLTFPTSNLIPWPFQHPKVSGCVYWLRLFKWGDKWQFLAAIIVHRTMVTTVAKYDHWPDQDHTWRAVVHGDCYITGIHCLSNIQNILSCDFLSWPIIYHSK